MGKESKTRAEIPFVKSVPDDAVLHLPPLQGVTLGPAYLLGDSARTPIEVHRSSAGITLSAMSLHAAGTPSAPADFLPVIAIPFKGTLRAQPPIISAGADGAFALRIGQADRFYNYNGNDYWASPTIYKLRWTIAASVGRYDLRIRYFHAERTAKLTLFLNGVSTPVSLEPSPASGSASSFTYTRKVTIRRTPSTVANPATVEITPRAFL
jgi:hypothetical protein